MRKALLYTFILIALASCTPLTLIDGTMLDDFTDTPPVPEVKVSRIIVDGDDWEIHYSVDGFRIDNVEIIGVMDNGSEMDISDKVAFNIIDNDSVEISYGGCTEVLPIKSGESVSIYIDPSTIYYEFYMPDVFPEDDDVFVGWGENDEPLAFPIINMDREKSIEIHPIYRKADEVFTLTGSAITGTTGTLYEFYGIPSEITAIEANAFKNNKTVKAVAFEEDSTITAINADTFYFSSLEYIEIPASVKTIETRAFDGAVNLKEVIFEEDSQLEEIKQDAFTALTMTEFTIPRSVRTIGRSAFGLDVYLEKIIFEEGTEITSIDRYAFDNDFSLKTIEFIDPASESIPEFAESAWGAPADPDIIWDEMMI